MPEGAHFPMTTNEITAETQSYLVRVYDISLSENANAQSAGPFVYAQGTAPTSLLHVGKRNLNSIASEQQVMIEFDGTRENAQERIQRVLTGPRVLTTHFAIDDMTLWSEKRVEQYRKRSKNACMPDDAGYLFEIGGNELVAWHEQMQTVHSKLDYVVHLYARNPEFDILSEFVHEHAHHKTGTASGVAAGISYLRDAVQECRSAPIDWCEDKNTLDYLVTESLPQLSRTLHQTTLKWHVADALRLVKNALRLAGFDAVQLRRIRLESFL